MNPQEKHYTVGEIFRNKLLLNKDGEPYKNKSAVALIVRGMKCKVINTAHGKGKSVPLSEIEKHNNLMKSYEKNNNN